MDSEDLALVNRRLHAIEWNLQRLMAQEGMSWQEPPPPSGVQPDVLEAVQAGNLIEAIKRYRAHTGVGLAEAKAAVEAIVP
jgi:ribosomal protein L7/L12